MQKKILTLLGSALIMASAAQTAAAAQPHHSHRSDRTAAARNEQLRYSNAYLPLATQPDLSHYDGALAPPAGQ